jgi:hypothetical protein
MNRLEKVLYTAKAHTTGGRAGMSRSNLLRTATRWRRKCNAASDLQATPAKIRASFCVDQCPCPTRAIKLSQRDEEGLALPTWELAGIGWQFNVPGRGRRNWLRSYQSTVCGW